MTHCVLGPHTHVVSLHGLKGVIEGLEVGDTIVRVGRGTLGVELDASHTSSGSLVDNFRGDGGVKLSIYISHNPLYLN